MVTRPAFFGQFPAALVLAAFMVSASGPAGFAADDPHVHFDSSAAAECYDVTTPEFVAAHPNEKLIEVRVLVSLLLERGQAEDLGEVVITIDSPQRRLRVIDFEPRTELVSDVAGEIEIVDSSEDSRTHDATIGGAISFDYGGIRATASPSAGAANQKRTSTKETYLRLPPKELLLAAGITNRQHGVFFKLRPSTQTSLEGMHEFICRFAVPACWRGDFLIVHCEARRASAGFLAKRPPVCGERRMSVGLYLAGDVWAKRLALSISMPPDEPADAAGAERPSALRWTSFRLPRVDATWLSLARPADSHEGAEKEDGSGAAAAIAEGSPSADDCTEQSITEKDPKTAPLPPSIEERFEALVALSGHRAQDAH